MLLVNHNNLLSTEIDFCFVEPSDNGLVRTGLDKPPTLNSALSSSLKMFKIHYCLQVSSLHSNFVYIYEGLPWSA